MQLAFGTGKLLGFSGETIEILLLLLSKTESKIWDMSAVMSFSACEHMQNPPKLNIHTVSLFRLSINKWSTDSNVILSMLFA